MDKVTKKLHNHMRRHARVRSRVIGSAQKPRLAVFHSNKYVYAQLIDDAAQNTIAAVDSRSIKEGSKQEKAGKVGEEIAKKAIQAGIEKVVFDRGGFQYRGIIAAVADGARKGGLQF